MANQLNEPPPETTEFATLPFPDFCAQHLVVQDKSGNLIPFHLNRVQRDLVTHLTGRDLVLKARQVGISTVIQAWHYYQICQGGARTSTLCHEDELTQEFREMADRFHDSVDNAHRPVRKYANARVTTYPDLNARARIATVGGGGGEGSKSSTGKRKGRGGTNTHLHGSEVAFWPDAAGVVSAAMQAGSPTIILESTPNGMVGWFYERCMEALDGDGVWALHFYPWWWEDDYCIPLQPGETLTYTDDEQALVDAHELTPEQIKWRRRKRAELPHTFAQEYPENPRDCFLASGTSYFGNVEHVFTAPLDVERSAKHVYVGGLDFGQTTDYTVLIILDVATGEMVDMLRINRIDWQEMRRQISVMANKWNARVIGEKNSMGTNIELLQKGEWNEDGTPIYEPVALEPFDTTPRSKPPLIQGLYHALHEVGLALQPNPDLRHELRAFISKQTASGAWSYEAGSGAHDDTVIALALAWWGASQPTHAQLHTAPVSGLYSSRAATRTNGRTRTPIR